MTNKAKLKLGRGMRRKTKIHQNLNRRLPDMPELYSDFEENVPYP